MPYTDAELVAACRAHAEQVNPKKSIDQQTISMLARVLRLSLTCIEKGSGVVTLNQMLQHVNLPMISITASTRFTGLQAKDLGRLD